MNWIKNKYLAACSALVVTASSFAQTTLPTPTEALEDVAAHMDNAAGYGGKAYVLIGGLALIGVIIAYLKRIKRG